MSRTGTKGFARRIIYQRWHPPAILCARRHASMGTMAFTLSCGHTEERRSPRAAKWKTLVCSTCRKAAELAGSNVQPDDPF